MIRVNDLHKTIGQVKALNGLSFHADNGTITGLLGPNGAGKTTCLRTLLGLLKADSGSASIDGFDIARQTQQARQQIGLFPDPFGLYERLTPREYVQFFAELNGMSSQAAKLATAEVLSLLRMDEIADRRCQGFSQGQRMKTALAQAIVHKPTNIVLDEPTRVLRELLLTLKQQGHCVLFSSHVMQEVAALCDQVVVMAKGRVLAQGSPAELCARTGKTSLEDAFITLIGTDEGIAA